MQIGIRFEIENEKRSANWFDMEVKTMTNAKTIRLSIMDHLSINRKRFNEFCEHIKRMTSFELETLAVWYREQCSEWICDFKNEWKTNHDFASLVLLLLPPRWMDVYARAIDAELDSRRYVPDFDVDAEDIVI